MNQGSSFLEGSFSLHKNVLLINALKDPFLVPCYTLIIFLLVASVVLLSVMIALSLLNGIRVLIC